MKTRMLFAKHTDDRLALLAVDDVEEGLGALWGDYRSASRVFDELDIDVDYWGLWVYEVEFDPQWAEQAANWNYLKSGTARRLNDEERNSMRCGGLPWPGEWI